MRCALDCLLYLNHYYEIDDNKGIAYLETHLTERGISIYDLVEALKLSGFQCHAITSWFLPTRLSVLFMKGKDCGHYLIFLKKTWFSVKIYDGKLGIRNVNKLMFYWCWSRISIDIEK